MRKIKIMQFIHGLNTGGAETLVKNYVLNFDNDKFDILVLCLEHFMDSPYEKVLSDNGIKVIYVEDYLCLKGANNVLAKFIKYIQGHIIVKRIIKEQSPDVIHSHLLINGYVKFAHPNKSISIFHTVHGDPDVLWNNKSLHRKQELKIAKWLVKHNDMRLIALDDKMREQLNALFGVNNTIVINNGVDVSRFKKTVNRNEIRKKIGLPVRSFVIGHVGRFAEQKNHVFLVKVFKEIKKHKKNAFLLMIGSGVEKNKVKQLLYENGLGNSFLMLSNRADIPEILGSIDVFVFPSFWEGLPVSLIEAQEAKLPCFISDSISGYSVISNLVTLLSVKNNPKEWANIIINYKKPKNIVICDSGWNIIDITRKLEKIYLESLLEKK